MNSHDEQVRLQRAHIFDQTALAAIYDDYHLPLYRYIYRQMGESETARDLTAEVFQRFLQALRQGQGPDQNLKAWLYRTAHNVVIDYFRRQKHRQHLPLNEAWVNANDNPASLVESHILAEDVRQALQQLTADQRQVLSLKFLDGLSNAEVADILEKPVGAVKSLQHRALAALQRHLAPAREKMLS